MINEKNLGGWAISSELYKWIEENISEGSTILELGSGTGTIELSKKYNMISIEHNPKWLNKAKNSTYINAPIKKYSGYRWYDRKALNNLSKLKYNVILVDGPPGSIGREGFLHNLDLFNTNVPIILDDTNRKPEKNLAMGISFKLNKPLIIQTGTDKEFIVIK